MGGGGDGADKVPEPNLTAMLDLVLQMLMFFIIVANFVTEQLNADIQLPEATTTLPIEKEEKTILILNVEPDRYDKNGRLVQPSRLILPPKYHNDREVLSSQGQIETALRDIFKNEKDPKSLTVVIRGDHTATFEQVYRVMKVAKEVGFVNVQLRAKFVKQ